MNHYVRRDWILALVLILVMMLVININLTRGSTTWGDDFAAYLTEGISISQKTFEEQIIKNYSLHPSPLPTEANNEKLVYVWGYPLILSVVHRFVGFDTTNYTSIIYYKIPNMIALSLTVGVLFLFYRSRFSTRISLFLVLMLVANGHLIYAVDEMLSDIMFLFFSVLSIWIAECAFDVVLNSSKISIKIALSILLATVLWLCYETRLSGLSIVIMVAALNVIMFVRNKVQWKDPRVFICFLPYVVFFILKVVSESILLPATQNLSDVGSVSVTTILRSILSYGKLTCKYLGGNNGYIAGFIWGIVFLIGFIKEGFTWKNIPISGLLLGTYVILILLPYHQGLRYMYNILPIILMYVAHGFLYIYWKIFENKSNQKNKKLAKHLISALAVVSIILAYSEPVANGMRNVMNDRRGDETDVYSPQAIELYHYIQNNISAEETVAFFKPRALYLNTGRMGFKPYVNGQRIADADYFLYYVHGDSSQPEILSDDADILTPVCQNEMFILYEINN